MIDALRDLGYRVEWSQGATPAPLREKHREAGWAWEGDTHVEHHVHVKHVDGEPVVGKVPIQHFDAEAAGYVPEHMILKDDSGQLNVFFVEGPVKGGAVGEPTGFEHSDGTPIGPFVGTYVREDDSEAWEALAEIRDAFVAELEQREGETPDETAERHQREAEERAAEES